MSKATPRTALMPAPLAVPSMRLARNAARAIKLGRCAIEASRSARSEARVTRGTRERGASIPIVTMHSRIAAKTPRPDEDVGCAACERSAHPVRHVADLIACYVSEHIDDVSSMLRDPGTRLWSPQPRLHAGQAF